MTTIAAAVRGLWFNDALVKIRVAGTSGTDGMSVVEHRARFHDSPPLHVHSTEDELFIILEGELRFRVGTSEHRGGPGTVFLAPKNIAHTFRVESLEGARWITVTARGDFERFLLAVSRPADEDDLPVPSGPPTEAALEVLARAGKQCGIELVGPPLN